MAHRTPSTAIAVIGMACRYPDAGDPRQLWENILARRRQFRRMPDCRLPLADYYDADKKAADKTYGRQAAVIDGFDFDWAARRIPLSTVQTTDIVHWLALETSLEAVADAGYTKESLPGKRTGVIVGNTLTGEQTRVNTMRLRWPFVRRALHAAARSQGMDEQQIRQLTRMLKDRYTGVFPQVDEDTLAGGLSNTIAGRICNQLDLMGGGFTIDGACSSSLLAVAQAAVRLADNDLDLAIVGGVDISLDPFELVGFAKTGALTDGDMTVYDRGGKGFIPGEGCGFMVLKTLQAARQDGNPVYAVLYGWGISSDGGGAGITAPSVSGQALALERAYALAPHGVQDLDFIEGHGTGTTVGDRTELEAIAAVMGRMPIARGQLRPCGITSIKSIIGHTKAASGIGGLIKAVMALNRRVIPPTAACRHPHQAFDAAARRLYPVRLGRIEDPGKQLTAGVSSMGFGGINCHLTLTSGDPPDRRLEPVLEERILLAHAQETELLVLGADSPNAMVEQVAELKQTADGISMAELADLSADLMRKATPNADVRAGIVAGHPDDLLDRLDRLEAALRETERQAAGAWTPAADTWLGAGRTNPRIGFLFPGQGSQQINMARTLVQRFDWARALVEQADRSTRKHIGIAVSRLIYRDMDRAPDPEERDRWFSALSRTENAQPAICLASLLWFEYLRRLGIGPDIVGGHSLGEVGAFYAGGVFDSATFFEFAVLRGKAMSLSSDTPGAMASLRCDEAVARDLIPQVDGYITVANLNSPRQTVLSGEAEAVAALLQTARESGVDARLLPVSSAFHSRLCEDAAREVGAMALLDTPAGKTTCLVVSSVDGKTLDAQRLLRDHFSGQMISPVNFMSMVTRLADGCDLMVEVGPGRVLSGLVNDILGDTGPVCMPVESAAGEATDLNRALAAMVALGQPIQWDALVENRLIRPFLPAAEKSFVASPCESLSPSFAADGSSGGTATDALPAMLAEAFTDVPDALVNRYLQARGGFLNQMIQTDLSFWDPNARPMGAGSMDPQGVSGPEAVQAALYRLVADATGFATGSLTQDSRLLDDLNLDSIKAGDLIAEFARTCRVSFPDPALLANAALGELIDSAVRLGGSSDAAGTRAPERASLEGQLIARVAEITGFPEASIDVSMRLLDDLNLDSIKAGDLIARLAESAGIAGRLDVSSLANARLAEVVDRVVRSMEAMDEPAAPPPDALMALLDHACRITGFSDDALDPDLPVEQGLHLGADKLETLVRQTAQALGIQAQLDIDPLLSRSLRQISEILTRLSKEQQGQAPTPAALDAQPTWVRCFGMDVVETAYPRFPDTWRQRSEDDWQKARVLILYEPDAHELAELFNEHLFQRGATVEQADFDAETAADLVSDAGFSHLVAILPKNGHRDPDRKALLRRLIGMRASIAAAPPAAAAPRRRTTVAYIQFGGGFFGRDTQFAYLDRCGAVALGASLHLERNDLRVRVVDLCPALPLEIMVWETLAELTTSDHFAAVGYDLNRTRRTLVPRLVQPAAFVKREISWTPEDVILVTGGAKGITAACALAVARETGARMALVGRSAHPDEAGESESQGEIRTLLKRYAELGLTAAYFSCDVADRKAVDRLLAQVEAHLGTVTGVIHGAGLNRPRLTGQVGEQQAYEETAPKVLGILHLLDALDATPPKLIVGMGSIIGITGMPGNGWYGFSNEVMDIALRGFAGQHPATRVVDVAYSIWRDEGMGARMGSVDLLRGKGIDAIPTDEGVGRFVRLFTHDPGRVQTVVTARLGGLDTWAQSLAETPVEMRFLETRVAETPGVEAVFSVQLALESDPYLRDHAFQDSFLFPTVFGLEAMVQAALFLVGRTELSRIQIRDVQLLRPITVDPEAGAEIAIRVVREESDAGGETRVRAGIVKAGTGISSDYFSATLIFDREDAAPEAVVATDDEPLPLVPATDLYRPTLLFQGPRFQRIQSVAAIQETGRQKGSALFSSRTLPPDKQAVAAFGDERPRRLFLGDAFFTDTLLQSAALLVPQDTSLPISIDRMNLYPAFFSETAPAMVRVELMGREGRDLIYQVTAASADGSVRAVLDGYRLRILKHHDDYPTVNDLVFPTERDARLIQASLEDACRSLTVVAPHVEVACIPDIHRMGKPQRHTAEAPLLEKTVTAACAAYEISPEMAKWEWQADGKPSLAGVAPEELDLSVTHEDRTCLCACGPGPVGCDLAAVTMRSREQWIGLLGDGRQDLLDELMGQGASLDEAGTRIWAAAESLIKAGADLGTPLRFVAKADAAMLLAADGVHVLTLSLRLTWGAPLILALTVAEKAVARVPEHLLTADYPGYEPLYETRSFEMIEGGPQGQLVFVQRLPVTFQPSANLSRTIYFSNFIKWMGNTREASAWPVLAEMSDQFASGRWGGVTNYGHLKILGEGGTSDQIEVLMWVSDNSGPENSTMTLSYDFRRMLNGGRYERLAFCRLQTTWVEILGPGVAKVAPYPAYYGQFIEDMCPQNDAPDIPEPLPEGLGHLFDPQGDAVVYQAPSGPVVRPIVREQTFETTLAQANLVGNIYYANYYEWQGQIRDRFFYERIPDYYHGIGEKGELLTLESRVDHLREAMPFDRILLTLAVQELRACSVTFHVDYFRLEPDNSRIKIAHGLHRAVWTLRDAAGRPQAKPFPQRVQAAFAAAIEEEKDVCPAT